MCLGLNTTVMFADLILSLSCEAIGLQCKCGNYFCNVYFPLRKSSTKWVSCCTRDHKWRAKIHKQLFQKYLKSGNFQNDQNVKHENVEKQNENKPNNKTRLDVI